MGSCLWSSHNFNPSYFQFSLGQPCILEAHEPVKHRSFSSRPCHISSRLRQLDASLAAAQPTSMAMANPWRARETTMGSITARTHQLVSEPFFPSPQSSADHNYRYGYGYRPQQIADRQIPPGHHVETKGGDRSAMAAALDYRQRASGLRSQFDEDLSEYDHFYEKSTSSSYRSSGQSKCNGSCSKSEVCFTKRSRSAAVFRQLSIQIRHRFAEATTSSFRSQLYESMEALANTLEDLRSIPLELARLKTELKAESPSDPQIKSEVVQALKTQDQSSDPQKLDGGLKDQRMVELLSPAAVYSFLLAEGKQQGSWEASDCIVSFLSMNPFRKLKTSTATSTEATMAGN